MKRSNFETDAALSTDDPGKFHSAGASAVPGLDHGVTQEVNMLPRSCRSRQVVGGKPGEFWARIALVTFGIGVLLGMVSCGDVLTSDMVLCGRTCGPRGVASFRRAPAGCGSIGPVCVCQGAADGGTVSR